MYAKTFVFCASLSRRKVLVLGVMFAILIEVVTLGCRFGLAMQSTRDTAYLATFTLGLRIHHGYIGVFLVPLAWCFPLGLRHALWLVAIGLIVSDLAHHFIVLWPITGSPQCDLVYPQHPYWRIEP